ncbi:hypothetical protein [Magnetococcus sp. PR-3]|uniref:hypothetical protein n=1 Tax=Magnetococcus sp. PR-3 TaxID=3120355 RepID=UPI002FCDFB34
MKIWCAISGHGMGHVGQVAPLLRALAHLSPTPLKLHIHCQVSRARLARKLHGLVWQHDARATDIGLVQHDPMVPDLPATAAILNHSCTQWEPQLAQESTRIQAFQPDLILADIPPLTLAAGKRLGIPTVALSSLSWDAIYPDYFADHPNLSEWLNRLYGAYAGADLALLPIPHMGKRRFPHTLEIPPIWERGTPRELALRQRLGIDPGDRRPVVLVSLGGIQSQGFPIQPLLHADHLHILADVPTLPSAPHIHGLNPLRHWPFADIMASVDGVVGKPGYNMAVESVAYALPFFYSARGHFADEPPIQDWLQQFGRTHAYPWTALQNGAWLQDWSPLYHQPKPAKPAMNGAEVGARALLSRFGTQRL